MLCSALVDLGCRHGIDLRTSWIGTAVKQSNLSNLPETRATIFSAQEVSTRTTRTPLVTQSTSVQTDLNFEGYRSDLWNGML